MKKENEIITKNSVEHLSLEGEGGTQCRVRGKVNKAGLICTPSSVLRASSKAEILFNNTPLCGTSPARGAEKEALCAKHPSRGKWIGAFTLIELLVVVLIIGILTAVAVPQYQKAVNKSRFALLQSMATSYANAVQEYYLANGDYPTHFNTLVLDTPGDLKQTANPYGSGKDTGTCAHNDEIYCCVLPKKEGQSASIICGRQDYSFAYQKNFTHKRTECVAKKDNLQAVHLCSSLGQFRTDANMPTPDGHRSGYSYYTLLN